MSPHDLLLVPLGIVAGAYGAVIGAGGGFVLVPAMLLIFPGRTAEEVTAVSLAMVLMSSVSASVAYARQRRIDYLTGILFGVAMVPTAVAGVFAVRAVPRPQFDVMFGVLLLALGAYTVGGGLPSAIRRPLTGAGLVTREVVTQRGETYRYTYRGWQGPVIGATTGFMSSLFGVGGGVMNVPAMMVLLRIPAHVAVATSSFIVLFMATAAVSIHLSTGELWGDLGFEALVLGASAVVGAQIGADMSRRFASVTITRLLVVALALVGVRLALRAFF